MLRSNRNTRGQTTLTLTQACLAAFLSHQVCTERVASLCTPSVCLLGLKFRPETMDNQGSLQHPLLCSQNKHSCCHLHRILLDSGVALTMA